VEWCEEALDLLSGGEAASAATPSGEAMRESNG
jgi:hypothetical protein